MEEYFENSTEEYLFLNDSTNLTQTKDQNEFYDYTNLTKWIIKVYFCFIFIGVCLNLYLIVCIIQQKKNGTLYIVLQISIIDLITTWVAVTEILSLHKNTWDFGPVLCPLFFGTEIVINTMSLYLHILLNFHTISIWNIQKKIEKSNKNPLTQDIDNSTECLVRSESSTANRTIYIDYRQTRTSLSILIPSLLIWFCCLSLSIPEYSLSTIVENYNNHTLCTMVDLYYGHVIRYLLVSFKNIIPLPLLLLTFTIILFITCNNSLLSIVKKSSLNKYEEVSKLIQLSLSLTILYILFSLQRCVFYFLHNIYSYSEKIEDKFKFAPLDIIIVDDNINLYLAMLHYFSIVLRPLLCILALPFTVKKLKNIFCTSKKDEN